MVKSINLQEHLHGLKPGFSIRDFLLDVQNYFLEGDKDSVRMMPSSDSLKDVEEIIIGLESRFCGFNLRVKELLILPDENVAVSTLLPEMDSIKCVGLCKVERDEDGVERIRLTIKA